MNQFTLEYKKIISKLDYNIEETILNLEVLLCDMVDTVYNKNSDMDDFHEIAAVIQEKLDLLIAFQRRFD